MDERKLKLCLVGRNEMQEVEHLTFLEREGGRGREVSRGRSR